jgi:hypothetical protein
MLLPEGVAVELSIATIRIVAVPFDELACDPGIALGLVPEPEQACATA